MEIFQTIWAALTTPNLTLSNILLVPISIVELVVGMLLFTTVLNIKTTTKQKLIYVTVIFIWINICNFLIPKPYGAYLNIIAFILAIMFIIKTNFLKAIIATFLPFLCNVFFETILTKLAFAFFEISFNSVLTIPVFRISFVLLINLCTFLVYLLIKKFRPLLFSPIDILNKNHRKLFIINFIVGFIAVSTQLYLTVFYTDKLPVPITLLSLISLIAYLIISIYSISKTSKLEITTENLEQSNQHNKTLELLYDNLKAFRHDFNNIIQSIGGYADSGDLEGLRKYYRDLNVDCKYTNNLSALSPKVINNPAIYNILANKYHLADGKGIKINLDIFLDLNTLNMQIYEFTRILGILLDNAIEATTNCEKKIINVIIRSDFKVNRQLLIVENTYENKEIDIDKIFEKGYTTKQNNTGLGLWEVRQILKRNTSILNLHTTKDDEFFRQQLEIYPKK